MCFRNAIASMLTIGATASTIAAPAVSNVKFSQEQTTRKVTITYSLANEQAIVTFDICTNGVSIGQANLTHFAGDANRVVPVGERTAYWYPDEAWPGHTVDGVSAVVTAWATNTPPDYMVADIADGNVWYYTSAEALPDGGLTNDVYRTQKIVFRKIPARGVTWRMGSPEDELGRASGNRETAHLVTLTKDYWFGVFPVTWGQHLRCAEAGTDLNTPPAYCLFTNLTSFATRPVQGIGFKDIRSWTANFWPAAGHAVDAGTFVYRLRAKFGNKWAFDIPTEAQWEYAARAGSPAALTTGANLTSATTDAALGALGRYDKNKGVADQGEKTDRSVDDSQGTSKVGIYPANNWGIYDIHGSTADLCLDRYVDFEASDTVLVDPVGSTDTANKQHVARGGFWGYKDNSAAAHCRLAARDLQYAEDNGKLNSYRFVGYRLCLEIQ